MKNKLRNAVIGAVLIAVGVMAVSHIRIEPAHPAVQEAKQQQTLPIEPPVRPEEQEDTTSAPAEEQNGEEAAPEAGKQQSPQPPQKAAPVCTIEIRCDALLDPDQVTNEAIRAYIPADGVILAKTTVPITPGESVFSVLLRVTRDRGIHMEYQGNSAYHTAYIEGIGYLYEFDGGPLSGWLYQVDGSCPNYGCAEYLLQGGEEILWVYRCDLIGSGL